MKKQQNLGWRRITEEELNAVNPKIMANFGACKRITSGLCESKADGKKTYHISIEDACLYNPVVELQRIGAEVKDAWGADEVYYFGQKIA